MPNIISLQQCRPTDSLSYTGRSYNRSAGQFAPTQLFFMSGVAGAYLLPSSRSQKTVYDQLKHMVPAVENRGQIHQRCHYHTYLPSQVLVSLLPQGHDGIDLSPFYVRNANSCGGKNARTKD
ncbi:hypothetical protein [Bradyrhizobium cenepequi]|uniref:hypothetical protein n=1 Tax=Bradyrhizobium cenepequi TaxID=2821403 RepID=UPI001CE2BD7C|nr:hypothetical protein [Bradyrhizobium cenepequi]MCA6108003.1 hypothetical protein [Bradyrhizobium cenepequi]